MIEVSNILLDPQQKTGIKVQRHWYSEKVSAGMLKYIPMSYLLQGIFIQSWLEYAK